MTSERPIGGLSVSPAVFAGWVMRPASAMLAVPTEKPTAPWYSSPRSPYLDNGMTARFDGFQNRKACGSYSAV